MAAPLFILAPPRSYTSVTCGMVGNHPQLMGLAETNLFAATYYRELTTKYRVRPRLQHGLLRCICELGLGGQTEENVETAKLWLEENLDARTADIFGDLAAWGSPRALVDKSPSYVFQRENLERTRLAFPDARYLHLTRHPRGTCESIYKMRTQIQQGSEQLRKRFQRLGKILEKRSNDTDLTPELMWLKPHMNVLGFLEAVPPEQKLRMQGEDLLEDPDSHLAIIAEWLGVRTDAEAIEAMKHPERSPFAAYGPPNAKFGNDPEFLENPALREYRRKALNLTDPLSWDPQLGFSREVIELAKLFGYSD